MPDSQENKARETPKELAVRLGLPFSDYLILQRALTHRSYMNEHPEALEDNERLEFLGDAVLDFVVGAFLYNRFPEMKEGELTRLRAALVRTEQLAEFAMKINLGAAIRLGRGEEESGGRTRSAMLCAVFEAIIGALYLDATAKSVEEFISPLLDATVSRILIDQSARDPKSQLQEWAQSKGFPIPVYKIDIESGPDHEKTFSVEVWISDEVCGVGNGRSKQSASMAAAKSALKKLKI
ncbi:MAG: ribonuclease III [Chloroflexi bacterium]|nr:ribonuclease III [Chloroflexota bacterium]